MKGLTKNICSTIIFRLLMGDVNRASTKKCPSLCILISHCPMFTDNLYDYNQQCIQSVYLYHTEYPAWGMMPPDNHCPLTSVCMVYA